MNLVIRKVQYAPENSGPQPMAETSRSFLMSDRSLHLEASLDKQVAQSHTLMCSLICTLSGPHTRLRLCLLAAVLPW